MRRVSKVLSLGVTCKVSNSSGVGPSFVCFYKDAQAGWKKAFLIPFAPSFHHCYSAPAVRPEASQASLQRSASLILPAGSSHSLVVSPCLPLVLLCYIPILAFAMTPLPSSSALMGKFCHWSFVFLLRKLHFFPPKIQKTKENAKTTKRVKKITHDPST